MWTILSLWIWSAGFMIGAIAAIDFGADYQAGLITDDQIFDRASRLVGNLITACVYGFAGWSAWV